MLLAATAAWRLFLKKSYQGEEKDLDVNAGGNEGALLEMVRSVLPSNSDEPVERRVGVLGGYKECMGRPYFTALAALKLGCDYSHVFCDRDVLSASNPEILVHPILESSKFVEQMYELLPRLSVLVVGPGLGRDRKILGNVKVVLERAKQLGLPIILDSFGILLVKQWPEIVEGYQNAILITNAIEFNFLYKNSFGVDPPDSNPSLKLVSELSRHLGKVTIMVSTQHHLLISNADTCLVVDGDESARKVGRWADILTGLTATFISWAFDKEKSLGKNAKLGCISWRRKQGLISSSEFVGYGACMCGVYGAGILASRLAHLTSLKYGQQNSAPNMLGHVHSVFNLIFDQNDPDSSDDDDSD